MSIRIKTSILFVFVLLELLSATYWQGTLSMNTCRILHILSGLGIVGVLFTTHPPVTERKVKYHWIAWLLVPILLLWCIPKLYHLFERNPLDYTHADMLPVIQVMCERWISHLHVYTIIPEIWGGVMPVYLPAMWLPFIPGVLFNFDLRWITTGMLIVAILWMLISHKSAIGSIFIFTLIGLWFDYILHVKNETMVLSEEAVVYAYHIGLVISLVRRNMVAIGIMVALCLMSRYGIVFFSLALPLYYFTKFKKDIAFKYVITLLVTSLVLMTVAGAWGNIANFIHLSGQYLDAISLNQDKYQTVLSEGLGLSPMIGLQHFNLIYWLQIILLILIEVAMVMYAKSKNRWFEIAFLKLTLVIFYNFMVIPYPYLMYTSVWVSIAILYFYADPVTDKSLNLADATAG